jgi:glutamate-1-semialdehyde 2,1-aminomutase
VTRVSTEETTRFFQRSERAEEMRRRAHRAIPAGAHTYSKGDDQFPELAPAMIESGSGTHVVDVDGNRFLDWGMGLRSVILGHAYPRVVEAVVTEVRRGSNFTRPSPLELELAEQLIDLIPCAEMVKFAKNGSDVTTAAIRLARAATGRQVVALCRDQPFFSTDDWFIGTTAMNAGIPAQDLVVTFPYGDLAATERLFSSVEVACVVLEAATQTDPPEGYLKGLRDLCTFHGVVLVFDEMITGFRWSEAGAQGLYGVTPDLSTFGKALGNGFAVSALAGKRDLMELGGLRDSRERVFLLSTTHGAETHSLAAAMAVMETYVEEGITEQLHSLGTRLAAGVREVATYMGVADHVVVRGRPSNLVFATLDAEGKPSQEYRTLFMRQLITHGVVGPSFVVSAALTDADIDQTLFAVKKACEVYRDALDSGDPAPWLGGRPVKPVFRRFA